MMKEKKYFSSMQRISKKASVFWVITLCSGPISNTFAAWSSGSSWNSSEESSSSRRNLRQQDLTKEVSPFSTGSNNLALDLGQVFLMGDLGKYSDSIGTQVHYSYGASDLFSFDSSFGYSEHADGKFSMISLLAGMRLNMSWYDKVVPYLVFGLGFYKPSFQDISTNSQSNTNLTAPQSSSSLSALLFGVHVGPGVDLELSKSLFFGAALTFHNMFGSTINAGNGTQLSVGGSYASFLLHLGTTF